MKRMIALAVAAAVLGMGISPTFAAVDPPKVPPKGIEGPDIRIKVELKGVERPDIRQNSSPPLCNG